MIEIDKILSFSVKLKKTLPKKAIIDEREYHWLDYDVYLATLESVPKGFEDYIPWGASFEKMQDANIIQILNYKEDSKC